jgi:quinol-cytochrome oxidoreductase complex cytochrome b subunit
MQYTSHIDFAFDSVEYLMRDVKNGWLLRYIHVNGVSTFFIVVYCHIERGLDYGSYMFPRKTLWCLGVVIFLLIMATAFTCYVLLFVLAGLTFIYVALLHNVGSSSFIKPGTGVGGTSFYLYFVYKDFFAFSCYLIVFVPYFPLML